MLDKHKNNIDLKGFIYDANQIKILHQLQTTSQKINKRTKLARQLQRCIPCIKFSSKISGYYLWGPVGRGKTYCMDLFFENLAGPKLRVHFHQFMRQIHQQLTEIQGVKNPVSLIAKEFSKYSVLCFDECFINNIADAMLLGKLLQGLYRYGVVCIMTSNIAPTDLYKDGTQREQFLPTIKFISESMKVIQVQSTHDYREPKNNQQERLITPNTPHNISKMRNKFTALTHQQKTDTQPLIVNKRLIPVIEKSETVLWLDFESLCNIPRCANDYLQLCHCFDTVLISGIPVIPTKPVAWIINFIYLIDICYDQKTSLYLCADAAIEHLYPVGPKKAIFMRTASRLQEMLNEDN